MLHTEKLLLEDLYLVLSKANSSTARRGSTAQGSSKLEVYWVTTGIWVRESVLDAEPSYSTPIACVESNTAVHHVTR